MGQSQSITEAQDVVNIHVGFGMNVRDRRGRPRCIECPDCLLTVALNAPASDINLPGLMASLNARCARRGCPQVVNGARAQLPGAAGAAGAAPVLQTCRRTGCTGTGTAGANNCDTCGLSFTAPTVDPTTVTVAEMTLVAPGVIAWLTAAALDGGHRPVAAAVFSGRLGSATVVMDSNTAAGAAADDDDLRNLATLAVLHRDRGVLEGATATGKDIAAYLVSKIPPQLPDASWTTTAALLDEAQ